MNCDILGASFIIRIWLEETVQEAGVAKWRGHITHVPSGKRRYIEELDEIVTFIVPYLGEMGVRLQKHWRVQHWLKQLKALLGRRSWYDDRGTD